MRKVSPRVKEMYDLLKPSEREEMYYLLQAKHVYEDLIAYDMQDSDLTEADYRVIADDIVYDDNYNLDFSYWDNLKAAIEDYESNLVLPATGNCIRHKECESCENHYYRDGLMYCSVLDIPCLVLGHRNMNIVHGKNFRKDVTT